MNKAKKYQHILEEKFEVRSFMVDRNSRLKLNYLTAIIQEAAWKHAEHLDFGIEYMQKNSVAWMLTRLRVHMNEYPVWRDELIIETWPKDIDGLCYVRDFYIKSNLGKILGAATSYWLLVDLTTKRPTLPDPHTHFLTQNKNRHGLDLRLVKIKADCKKLAGRVVAGFGDIDLNNHVNSNKYVEWITNILPEDHLGKGMVRTLQMNYVHEVLLGEEIFMFTENRLEENALIVEGKNTQNLCFQALVGFD